MPFPDAQYPYDQRLAKHAELLLDTLEDAKSELIHLYEQVYPRDSSDNATTEVIDEVIAVLQQARGEE
jgi:hypothetical protein